MVLNDYRPALDAALRSAADYLEDLPGGPVAATATLADLRGRLGRPLSDDGEEPEAVIRQLVEDTRGGLVGSSGGRFFAWAIGGVLPAALAADWLTAVWDQNAGLYLAGPAAAVAEEVAGAWLLDLFGLPAECSFAFVSGCQMAHATCLAAARHHVLAARGWDVERDGLCGAPRIRLLASNPHGSIERAVRLLGLGAASARALPLNEHEQLEPATLTAALAEDPDAPTIVILQAGDLNTASFDRYAELIPTARAQGAWVHVDGAFGLWAAASPRYRPLLAGHHLADSWATDGHKWLNVPYDCGYAMVRHPAAHRAAMALRAPYLVYDSVARDQLDWNPEWSRRARGFATYAALRQLGRCGVAELVEGCCRWAAELVDALGALPGVEVLWRPGLNQGLVRFPDPAPGATEEHHDAYTDRVVGEITARGEAFLLATTWRGRRAMRVSVLNWQTGRREVERAAAAVREALAAARG